MTRKRRMPVNVLSEEEAEVGGRAALEALVGGPQGGLATEGRLERRNEPAGAVSRVGPLPSSQVSCRERLEQRRLERAEGSVRGWAAVTAVVGLLPVAPIPFLLIAGLQFWMIRGLAGRYGARSPGALLKGALASLCGGAVAVELAAALGQLWGAGPLATVLWLAVSAAASSYVVGRLFVKHLEAGGTLLNLDSRTMKDYFREKYGEGA